MRDSNELIHRWFAKTETTSGSGIALTHINRELPGSLVANSKPFTLDGPDGPPLESHSGQ
jgi:hypothetical protein